MSKHGPSARTLMLRRDRDRRDGPKPIIGRVHRTIVVPGNTDRAYEISLAKVEWMDDCRALRR